MRQVLVDMHRLKYHAYNGLYRFSSELGHALAKKKWQDLELNFYVPQKDIGVFGEQASYVKHRSVDKFYKFGTSMFDVWHATTSLSWYRPFNNRTKFVFTLHDLNFLEEEERSKKHRDRYLRLIRQRIERADFITYISEYTRQYAKDFLNIDNKPGKVIYNGCNIPMAADFTKPTTIPEKPFLFSIGLFMSRKNFHVLPSLLRNNDMELMIAGMNNSPYKDVIMQEAKRFGVEGRVKFPGSISEQEKFWYYQNCQAFLFPSIGEGFGLPIIEAMWFGKPVFLSTATCLPEIGGEAAYYFESFDPNDMQAVFEKGMQHYYQTQPQELIKQRAASFSWDKAAKEYTEIYRQL
jgi:glycosyltransferase involved in cell wall biosynthesis